MIESAHHCVDDVLVARATAQIPGEKFAHFFLGGIRSLSQQLLRRHQYSWSAKSALKGVVLPKSVLKFAEAFFLRQPFHGHQFRAIRLHGEQKTRANTSAIHEDGAGATDSVLAADVRTRQVKVFAQKIREEFSCFNGALVLDAIHSELNRFFHVQLLVCMARSRASSNARRVSTSARLFRYSAEAG